MEKNFQRHARFVVLGVMVVGLALRLWVVFAASPLGLHGDEISYWRRAALVLAHGDPGTAMQPPLMAYVFAPVRWWQADGLLLARGLNIVWYLLGAVALLALARGWRQAVVPLCIYTLHPVMIGFAGYLWSEPFFIALLLAAFALAERRSHWAAAAAGTVFGLATLTRQIGLTFFAIVLARCIYETWPPRTWVWRPAVMALGLTLVVSPWLARNWFVLGEPVFTTNAGFGLWVGNQRDVGQPYGWQYLRLGQYASYYGGLGSDELARDKEASRRARAFIASELPGWIFKKTTVGLAHLYEPDNFVLRRVRLGQYGFEALASLPWIGAITLGGELVVLVWGVYVTLAVRDRPAALMLLAMMIGNAAIHVISVGHARHRMIWGLLPLVVTGVPRKPFSPSRLAVAVAIVTVLLSFGLAAPGREQLARTFAGDGRIEQLPPALDRNADPQ